MAVLHFFFQENRFRRQIKSEIYGFTEVLCALPLQKDDWLESVLLFFSKRRRSSGFVSGFQHLESCGNHLLPDAENVLRFGSLAEKGSQEKG